STHARNMDPLELLIYIAICLFVVLAVALICHLFYALMTDNYSYLEKIPGFIELCKFGRALDHTVADHFAHAKNRIESTCSSASCDEDEDYSLSDDPEFGDLKTRWRDQESTYGSGDLFERRRHRRSEV
ncbi:hypothetical protein PFISCL1PPCAC_21922, partial [Pristionchus fissidentatus]